MGDALLAIMAGAGRAARALEARIERLFEFLRDFVFPGGDVTTPRVLLIFIVIAAVGAGVVGTRALIGLDPPTTPGTPIAAGVPAAASTDPTPSPTPSPTPEPTPEPSPTPTPEATPEPTPTPAGVVIRGPINTSAMSATGLTIGTHEARLAFDPDGGPVTGTFTIEIKRFPIGSLLTHLFAGDRDPDYAQFKRCTVTLALVGRVKGTYDAATGKLSGKAAFKAATDDVKDCLKTRPSNITIDPDKVAKPTTVTWRATFNGTRATGTVNLKPAMRFGAVTED
jgi:hypothetical protein